MIEFTRSQLTKFATHYVANKGLGEALTLTDKIIELNDDFIKDTLLRYLTSPFKTDLYYQFKSKNEMHYHDVKSYIAEVFGSQDLFITNSKKIAEHLYNQSMHPKIKGGEFYMCYFRDCVVDGVVCDAIGIFKTENKETYLKVYEHMDNFDIECDNGINTKKLDKGCLIFNTEQEKGYKISVIDNNNKVAECAFYWVEDFLNLKIKENAYYHTSNMIDVCVGFCEEILTEDNGVQKMDNLKILNNSVSFFTEKDKFNSQEFEKEVLKNPDLIDSFNDYKKVYNEKMNRNDIEDFEISATAVKKNKKYQRSIIKLDKNFHIYIHGRHDYIEKGYDDEKGLKFYKVYYTNEEV